MFRLSKTFLCQWHAGTARTCCIPHQIAPVPCLHGLCNAMRTVDAPVAQVTNPTCDKAVSSDGTGNMWGLVRQVAGVQRLLSCYSIASYTSMVVVHTRDQTLSQRQVHPACRPCQSPMEHRQHPMPRMQERCPEALETWLLPKALLGQRMLVYHACSEGCTGSRVSARCRRSHADPRRD